MTEFSLEDLSAPMGLAGIRTGLFAEANSTAGMASNQY
jgi:hypothetical protein